MTVERTRDRRQVPLEVGLHGLWTAAERHLRRCLELEPDGKMLDDAKDLLSSIVREDVE